MVERFTHKTLDFDMSSLKKSIFLHIRSERIFFEDEGRFFYDEIFTKHQQKFLLSLNNKNYHSVSQLRRYPNNLSKNNSELQ